MGRPCSRGGAGWAFARVKQARDGHAACLMSSFVMRNGPGTARHFSRAFRFSCAWAALEVQRPCRAPSHSFRPSERASVRWPRGENAASIQSTRAVLNWRRSTKRSPVYPGRSHQPVCVRPHQAHEGWLAGTARSSGRDTRLIGAWSIDLEYRQIYYCGRTMRARLCNYRPNQYWGEIIEKGGRNANKRFLFVFF